MLPRNELRRLCGQIICCGFEGTGPSGELKEVLREIAPGGLILFSRNIEDAEQLAELNYELKGLVAQRPLWLGVDQEGGRIARVRNGVTPLPPMAELGRVFGDDSKQGTALARRVGEILGCELRALGFDMNFAPVLDVATEPNNPVIGDRALATTPHAVAELGAALIDAMQGTGIAACGKHFPGHGDTLVDSHVALPRIKHDIKRLKEVLWPPFAKAIAHQVAGIMTAHVWVERLEREIATLSPVIVGEWLRRTLGFAGCVFSDDVDTQGLCAHVKPLEFGARAVRAGVDCLLACRSYEAQFDLYRGLILATERGELTAYDLQAAARRNELWLKRFWRPALEPKAARTELSQWTQAHSLSLVKSESVLNE